MLLSHGSKELYVFLEFYDNGKQIDMQLCRVYLHVGLLGTICHIDKKATYIFLYVPTKPY